MQVLGKIQLQGREKEIVLKEEDLWYKYYSLEFIGVYEPRVKTQKIIFKKELPFLEETKREIMKLVNDKISLKMLQTTGIFQILGQVPIGNLPKEIVAKTEGDMLKYYYLNLIGIYTPKIPGETIIFKEDTLVNAVANDTKDNQQRANLSPLEKQQIKEFLERIKILDVFERLQTQERGVKETTKYHKTVLTKGINQRQLEQKQSRNHKTEAITREQKQPQKVENQLKDINVKQEVDMDTRVTDMKNLEQVLENNGNLPPLQNGDEPLKMGIVESDDLKNLRNEKGQKEQGHTSRYETVLMTKQGKVHALDLKQDGQEGNNPLEKNYQVKQNDTVKKGDVLTRLKVGEGTIGIEKGQYGEVEVYHSPRKTIGGNGVQGNKSLDRQLETSNAKNTLEGTHTETLKLAQEYQDGYRSVEEGYQEIETHQKDYPDCEPQNVKDIDGDRNTYSHTHEGGDFVELSSGEKITYDELASRWGFYKDGKPDALFVKEKFLEKQGEDKKPDDVIEELEEEYQDPRAPQQDR